MTTTPETALNAAIERKDVDAICAYLEAHPATLITLDERDGDLDRLVVQRLRSRGHDPYVGDSWTDSDGWRRYPVALDPDPDA